MQNIRAAFVHQHSDGALMRTYCPLLCRVFFFRWSLSTLLNGVGLGVYCLVRDDKFDWSKLIVVDFKLILQRASWGTETVTVAGPLSFEQRLLRRRRREWEKEGRSSVHLRVLHYVLRARACACSGHWWWLEETAPPTLGYTAEPADTTAASLWVVSPYIIHSTSTHNPAQIIVSIFYTLT